MVTSFRFLVVMACSVALGACSTLSEVPDWQTSLRAGDRVSVATRMYDSKVEMKLSEVSPDGLRGWNRKRTALTIIPADQIVEVQRRQTSAMKTTFLVVGIVGVTYALLYAVAIASLSAEL